MSKLLSQGGFGCVYHPGIKCDGKKDKKKYVSKLQINDYTAFNEVEIGEIIKTIPNYHLFFLPIIEYCKVNATEMNPELINKCNTLHDQTNLVLMKMNFMKNSSFFDYIIHSQTNDKIFSSLIDKYLFLLDSLELLNSKNIVHFDLKDENILLNKTNNNPIIIDFGISLDMNEFKIDYIQDYFYVFAPEYYIWSFDIHLICFLSRKVSDDNYKLEKKDIENIAYDFVVSQKILSLFSEQFNEDYKKQCIDFGSKFLKKTKIDVLKQLVVKENYETWDNFALSCIVLKSIKYMFDKKIPNIELFKNIIQLAFTNMHPDPSNRYTVKKTKEKLNKILENIEGSPEELFTLTNKIEINKNNIDIEINRDNQTIQDITKKSKTKTLV